jgi:predicted acyl esterase
MAELLASGVVNLRRAEAVAGGYVVAAHEVGGRHGSTGTFSLLPNSGYRDAGDVIDHSGNNWVTFDRLF